MYTQVEKSKNDKSRAVANTVAQKKNNVNQGLGFVDNRTGAVAQSKLCKIINNRPQMEQCGILQEKINKKSQIIPTKLNRCNSKSELIQFALDGDELTIPLIGEKAESESYGLYQWNNGDFISSEESDINTFEVHVHNYDVTAADDDNVTLTGHAVWKKQFGTGNRNQQPLTVTGTRIAERWNANLALGAATINIPGSADTDGKTELYNDVVNNLDVIVKDTLNEE